MLACIILLTYLWVALFSLVFRVARMHAESYSSRIGPDVDAQLAHIRRALHAGEPGALGQPDAVRVVFSHTFYGFALVNTVLLDPENHSRRADAIRELEWILDRLAHPAATRGLAHTEVPHGVFYASERNLTLAGLVLVDPNPDPAYEREYHESSQELYEAFVTSPSAHLQTFPGHCWPADNIPALYSLAVHDRLYGTDYSPAIDRWVDYMAATLDPDTGLMPTKVDCRTGEALDVPRGCGLSFTFAFLPDLAPAFAQSQYAAYRQRFFKTTLGFAGMREFPAGRGRSADIDSGPIFLDVGAGATGLGVPAAKAMGDASTFESLLRLAEIIGFPVRLGETKSYLFGQLLVADGILVWGKTITPWVAASAGESNIAPDAKWPPVASVSLAWFYGIAVLVTGALLGPTIRLLQRNGRAGP